MSERCTPAATASCKEADTGAKIQVNQPAKYCQHSSSCCKACPHMEMPPQNRQWPYTYKLKDESRKTRKKTGEKIILQPWQLLPISLKLTFEQTEALVRSFIKFC